MLLGGNALLIRTQGGRFTQDIDLARQKQWPSVEEARVELEKLASRPYRADPFEFELYAVESKSEQDPFGYGAETGKVKARALLGNLPFEEFNVDITTRRHVDAAIDQVPLRAVIDHPTLKDLPTVPTTPVENHLADKVCALYEQHGENKTPSTRYRDLADIVRIVSDLTFDAARLSVVLSRESGRRRMTLPADMRNPGPLWAREFPKAAAGFAEFPSEYHRLEDALRFAGACLNEVLDGRRDAGFWHPAGQAWGRVPNVGQPPA